MPTPFDKYADLMKTRDLATQQAAATKAAATTQLPGSLQALITGAGGVSPDKDWNPNVPLPALEKKAKKTAAAAAPAEAPAGPASGSSEWWMEQLKAPITADIGLTEQERQAIYNLARRQTQGATNAMASEAEAKMGGRGFRAGMSGIADTALGSIYNQGAERLGQVGLQTAIEEAQNRFDQGAKLGELNLARITGGGDLASKIASNNIAAGGLGLESEKFAFSKEQASLQNLMDYMGMMQSSQNNVYNPYWNSLTNAIGA